MKEYVPSWDTFFLFGLKRKMAGIAMRRSPPGLVGQDRESTLSLGDNRTVPASPQLGFTQNRPRVLLMVSLSYSYKYR